MIYRQLGYDRECMIAQVGYTAARLPVSWLKQDKGSHSSTQSRSNVQAVLLPLGGRREAIDELCEWRYCKRSP